MIGHGIASFANTFSCEWYENRCDYVSQRQYVGIHQICSKIYERAPTTTQSTLFPKLFPVENVAMCLVGNHVKWRNASGGWLMKNHRLRNRINNKLLLYMTHSNSSRL